MFTRQLLYKTTLFVFACRQCRLYSKGLKAVQQVIFGRKGQIFKVSIFFSYVFLSDQLSSMEGSKSLFRWRLYRDAVDFGSFRHCWLAPKSKFTLANLHEYEASFESYYKLILEQQWWSLTQMFGLLNDKSWTRSQLCNAGGRRQAK